MKAGSLLLSLLLSAGMFCGLSNVAQAHKHGYHHGHHHQHPRQHCHKKTMEPCCSTAKMRYERGGAEYWAGCRAAATYVEGSNIGSHGKAWNEGFSDCRFNVYRSSATEAQAEKTICGYSPCCR